MSADNWATCPRCLHAAETASANEREAVNAMYGTVPIAEFDRRRAELTDIDPEQYRTFREDYEIYGAESGTVVVDYRGGCAACGASARIEHSSVFWDSPA
jgi:hypothetical protein